MERIIQHPVRTAKARLEVRSFSYPRHTAGIVTHHDDSCFISFALDPRPTNARGTLRQAWSAQRSERCGDITFVPPGMTLVGSCDGGPQRYLACNLEADLFTIDWKVLGDRAFVEALNLESAEARRALQRLFIEISRPRLTSPIAIDALAALLAIDIQRHLEELHPASSRTNGGLSGSRLRLIEARLHSDLPIPTLGELAKECGLSVRHLARAFQEETGRTIGSHVNQAVRDRAFQMLRASDLPIGEIARRLGFSSTASFSYAFRRDTGQTPGSVRKGRAIAGDGPPAV